LKLDEPYQELYAQRIVERKFKIADLAVPTLPFIVGSELVAGLPGDLQNSSGIAT
jgi:hypothetical protein